MFLHYLSILLGLLFGAIVLACITIHFLYKWLVNEDERMFRIQKRVDDYQEDDVSR